MNLKNLFKENKLRQPTPLNNIADSIYNSNKINFIHHDTLARASVSLGKIDENSDHCGDNTERNNPHHRIQVVV